MLVCSKSISISSFVIHVQLFHINEICNKPHSFFPTSPLKRTYLANRISLEKGICKNQSYACSTPTGKIPVVPAGNNFYYFISCFTILYVLILIFHIFIFHISLSYFHILKFHIFIFIYVKDSVSITFINEISFNVKHSYVEPLTTKEKEKGTNLYYSVHVVVSPGNLLLNYFIITKNL